MSPSFGPCLSPEHGTTHHLHVPYEPKDAQPTTPDTKSESTSPIQQEPLTTTDFLHEPMNQFLYGTVFRLPIT